METRSRHEIMLDMGTLDGYLATLSPLELEMYHKDWLMHGRPKQFEPKGLWSYWCLIGGRGSGKTRTGAETMHLWAERLGKGGRLIGMGPTAGTAEHVMVKGESGMLATAKPWNPCHWHETDRVLTWRNGCMMQFYSAEEPTQVNGPQAHGAWYDEIREWKNAGTGSPDKDPFALAEFMVRLPRPGWRVRKVVTSTPRPVPIIVRLLRDKGMNAVVTRMGMMENSRNLDGSVLSDWLARYERGSALYRQEIDGELLENLEGARWSTRMIAATRRGELGPADWRRVERVSVGIDPAVGGKGGHCGIVAVARIDGVGYVVGDWTADSHPASWGRAARSAARHYLSLSDLYGGFPVRVVVEVNQGGELVRENLRAGGEWPSRVPITDVWASRNKRDRAEPVVMLYENGMVRHAGVHPDLEEQMVMWVPGEGRSPDRIDALGHAVNDCMERTVARGEWMARWRDVGATRPPATRVAPKAGNSGGLRRWRMG